MAFPRIASAKSEATGWAVATRSAKIGIPAIAGFVAAVLLALPILVPLLFGDAFAEAISLGRILLVAAFFLSVHRLLTELARGLGHPGYGSITEAVNGLAFVLGVVVFATPVTSEGVALAVLAGGIACTFAAILPACSAVASVKITGRSRALNPDHQSEHYGRGYDYHEGSPHLKHRHVYEKLTDRIATVVEASSAVSSPPRVLEIGAGDGSVTERLLARGYVVTATEMSEDSIESMKLRFGTNDRFTAIREAGEMPATGYSNFDAVLFASVLHHVPTTFQP